VALASGRHVKFVAVINDELIPTELPGKLRQHHALPVKAQVKFDESYTVYDLQNGGSPTQADSLDLSFHRSEARLFALTKAPLKKLHLSVMDPYVRAGASLHLNVSVTDSTEALISDPLPFEITLTEPSVKDPSRFFRTLGPKDEFVFRVPVNSALGDWILEIQELVSGLKVSVPIHVGNSIEKPTLIR
jgi:hypothetical protein